MVRATILVMGVLVGAATQICHAQTATVSVQFDELQIPARGETVVISTGLFPASEPFLAWRFTSDFSQLNDTSFPASASNRVRIDDPDGNAISPNVRPLNGDSRPGSDVDGLVFASTFDVDPASFATVGLHIVPGGASSNTGVYADAEVEFFAASDIPEVSAGTGPLVAGAPEIDVELGFVALDGDALTFAVDDQNGAWDEPELGLFSGDGTLLPASVLVSSFADFTFGPSDLAIGSDGSISFRRIGAGEYAVAVLNGRDRLEDSFDVDGDSTIAVDAIVLVNGATAVVPMAAINGDPDSSGWIRFAVGARAADFNFDGVADAADVTDFVGAADAGVADFNSDGSSDFFDVIGFLRAFDAGG